MTDVIQTMSELLMKRIPKKKKKIKFFNSILVIMQKAMAPHSSTLA